MIDDGGGLGTSLERSADFWDLGHFRGRENSHEWAWTVPANRARDSLILSYVSAVATETTAGPNPLRPQTMTAEQRLRELSNILAGRSDSAQAENERGGTTLSNDNALLAEPDLWSWCLTLPMFGHLSAGQL